MNSMESKVIRPTSPGIFPVLEDGFHEVALGNGTQYRIAVLRTGDRRRFVGVESKGCYSFGTQVDPGYVKEKLKVLEGDAENIADFINCQVIAGMPSRVYGYYHDINLLAK